MAAPSPQIVGTPVSNRFDPLIEEPIDYDGSIDIGNTDEGYAAAVATIRPIQDYDMDYDHRVDEWLMDTGSGHDLLEIKYLDDPATQVKESDYPLTLNTANGPSRNTQRGDCCVPELGEMISPVIMTSAPPCACPWPSLHTLALWFCLGAWRSPSMGYSSQWPAHGFPQSSLCSIHEAWC